VIARIGGEPAAAAQELPAAATLKLGTRTRNALRGAGATVFEVEVDGHALHLEFSTALLATADATGGASFSVEHRAGAEGRWAEIFRSATTAGEAAWSDHRTALPSAALHRLRFSATTQPAEASGLEPVWGSVSFRAPAGASQRRRPNVLLIVLDTLGAAFLGDWGGAPDASPHIDAFIDQGFAFRRAYAQYGNTLVSRASLFSALHPIRHRVYPGLPGRPLAESLVAQFARAGYRTVAFTEGAFVSANFGFSVGFDAYDDGSIGLAKQMAGGAARTFRRASRWLAEAGARQRFFLFVHTYEVHSPYLPRDDASRRFAASLTPGDARLIPPDVQAEGMLRHNRGGRPIPDRDLARLAALHAGEIHHVDRIVGAFLEQLEDLGLARDTLVILTADHGDQFGEHGKVGHGESLHDRVLHVPLAFRWPGELVRGESFAPVQLVDVMPTILDLAGIGAPADLDGRSLAATLRGGSAPQRPAYSEQRSARGECLQLALPQHCRLDRFAVQTERWKLVTSERPAWTRLDDLERDPLESRDVAAKHPDEVARHLKLLDAHRARAAPEPAHGEGIPVDPDTLRRLHELGYVD
jgi:arylsulfatase A-like enzyme